VARFAGVNYESDVDVCSVALVDASLRRLIMLAIILGGLALAMAAAIVVDIATDTQAG
jgi:energy-converting hydrogenase Eha subunit C